MSVQFVGPSPLPSPSKGSPLGPLLPTISTALLALTEDPPSSSRAAAAAAQVAATTEVTTHVETAASAGADRGGGGVVWRVCSVRSFECRGMWEKDAFAVVVVASLRRLCTPP